MIEGDGWEEVAHGLVSRGLCQVVPEDSIFKVQGRVLLNGLFAVAKDEIKDGIPLSRLIMTCGAFSTCSELLHRGSSTWPSERRCLAAWFQWGVRVRNGTWRVKYCRWGT